MKTIIFSAALMLVVLISNALPGSITNIQVSQGSGANERLVSIQFDLSGSDATYNIALEVSFDNGATFVPISPAEITGSLKVVPGNGIQLIWDGRISYPQAFAAMARIRITAEASSGVFTDSRDSQTYKWTKIGNQVWMAENLKYLPDADKNGGSSLSLVGPGTSSDTNQYAYVFGYDGTNVVAAKATANYQNYGVLYNWAGAMAGSSPSDNNPSLSRGICPLGWHLPSFQEWKQLIDYLGLQGYPNQMENLNGAASALKSCRQVSSPLGEPCSTTTHPRWDKDNLTIINHRGTDVFGFSALPGGALINENFNYMGLMGLWWTTTATEISRPWILSMRMTYVDGIIGTGNVYAIDSGLSVRCLRDQENQFE